MSNKTQLQTNNTALASLTDRVLAAKDTAAALPDAGSGGGSSVETCTVSVGTKSSLIARPSWSFLVYENNALSVYHPSLNMLTMVDQIVVENVVCGSFIYTDGFSNSPVANVTQNVTVIDDNSGSSTIAVVNAPAGGRARINFE